MKRRWRVDVQYAKKNSFFLTTTIIFEIYISFSFLFLKIHSLPSHSLSHSTAAIRGVKKWCICVSARVLAKEEEVREKMLNRTLGEKMLVHPRTNSVGVYLPSLFLIHICSHSVHTATTTTSRDFRKKREKLKKVQTPTNFFPTFTTRLFFRGVP